MQTRKGFPPVTRPSKGFLRSLQGSAHLAISFAAFACIRHLMYRLKPKALSPEVIRNALIHAWHSVFKHKRTQQNIALLQAHAGRIPHLSISFSC